MRLGVAMMCALAVAAAAPNTEDLPPVGKLADQLKSGELTLRDVVNMTPRMSLLYLLDLVHSLPDDRFQQVREIVRADASAATEATEELDQHRLLLYLSLGAVLALAAVLVVAALLLLVGRLRCSQQSVDDQPPAMERLAAALTERQLTPEGNDKRPRTTSSGSALGSSRSSVDHHEYEPIRQDLLPPLPVDRHQYEPIRTDLLLPLPEAPPSFGPTQYEGSCAKSQVYESLLDR